MSQGLCSESLTCSLLKNSFRRLHLLHLLLDPDAEAHTPVLFHVVVLVNLFGNLCLTQILSLVPWLEILTHSHYNDVFEGGERRRKQPFFNQFKID